MSKLEAILSQEVEAEIQALLQEAEAKAEAVKREAEEKAKALLQARERALEAQYRAALRRAESAGELLVATARTQARGEVLEEVRRRVREALEALPGAKALVANPEDLPHLEALARERGVELQAEPALRLGVRAVGAEGKTQVENSLLARLDRAWDALSSKVAQALWG